MRPASNEKPKYAAEASIRARCPSSSTHPPSQASVSSSENSAGARRTNAALSQHSPYSPAASESKVMPLPTPSSAAPPWSTRVRMPTLNAASPGEAKPMAPQ